MPNNKASEQKIKRTRKLSWSISVFVAAVSLIVSIFNLVIMKAGYGNAWDTYANAEVRQLAADITNECETEYDKAYALYIWMSENMTYDINFKADAEWYSTPSKVIADKRGSCEEFSSLYSALCHSVGIRCYVVSGESVTGLGNHAWNLVYADGIKYRIDTTMGASNYQRGLPIGFDSSSHDQYFKVFAMH